jgi:hypothetical protein
LSVDLTANLSGIVSSEFEQLRGSADITADLLANGSADLTADLLADGSAKPTADLSGAVSAEF